MLTKKSLSKPKLEEDPSSYPTICPSENSDDTDSPPQQAEGEFGTRTGLLTSFLSTSKNLQPRANLSGDCEKNIPLEAPWGIHWYTPTLIILLVTTAIVTSCIHHSYYLSLDGNRAGDTMRQARVIRIGTGLGFLFKTAIIAAVSISRKQCVWATLRKRAMTLEGIDAMFEVVSDPFYFANLDMILRARLATLIALIMWVMPLASLFTPSTISVTAGGTADYEVNCTAPTVKYSFDNQSAAILRSTSGAFSISERLSGTYNGPSYRARTALTVAAYCHVCIQKGITIEGCPRLGTCSYTMPVVIPYMNCTADDHYETDIGLWKVPERWATNFDNVPEYPIFLAKRDRENRNTLRILHTELLSDQVTLHQSLITCRSTITAIELRARQYDDTNIDPTRLSIRDVGFLDDMAKEERPGSQKYDAALVDFDMIVELLEGSIVAHWANQSSQRNADELTEETNGTKIWSLTGNSLLTMNSSRLERYLTKFAYEMAMMPLFTYASNASATLNTTCSVHEEMNVYRYDAPKLLVAYAITTVVGMVIAALGFHALSVNGVASDSTFSTILLTTRNPTLDLLGEGSCIGGNPLPDHLKMKKLRFGELHDTGGCNAIMHTAIGLDEEVSQIRRRGRYS